MKKSFLILLVLCAMGIFVSSHAENNYKNPYYERGYLGNVALGGTVSIPESFGSRFTFLTSHGYSYGNGAFLGFGLGLISSLSYYHTIPLFANFKYSFLDKPISPFMDYKMGASYNSFYDMDGLSVYVSPSVGIDVGKFSFSISYIFQDYLTENNIHYDTTGSNIVYGEHTYEGYKDHWLNFTVAVNF